MNVSVWYYNDNSNNPVVWGRRVLENSIELKNAVKLKREYESQGYTVSFHKPIEFIRSGH